MISRIMLTNQILRPTALREPDPHAGSDGSSLSHLARGELGEWYDEKIGCSGCIQNLRGPDKRFGQQIPGHAVF